jgi:hypothetical protein
MNIAVWIVTGLLAAMFALAGVTKLARSKAQLVRTPHRCGRRTSRG